MPYVEPFELSEPSDEDMELARKLIAKSGRVSAPRRPSEMIR